MTFVQREPGYKWHMAYTKPTAGEKAEAVCGMKFYPTRATEDRLIALPAGICRECEDQAYHEAQLARHDG